MINETNTVKDQYRSSDNLSTRISIHDKYSTNKQGFGNWVFSNCQYATGCSILELGCGTGNMWIGRDEIVNASSRIVLSDFSEGMINTAKDNLKGYDKIKYQVIDIQDIPYEDDSFDIVIGNMMLYHVPDLDKGLSEVRRVLKPGGTFYCATFGEHGIVEYLSKVLGKYGVTDNTNKIFTLQNGAGLLGGFFSDVERKDYIDSLAVTAVNDIVDYLYSLSSMTDLNQLDRDEIVAALTSQMKDGVLNIPKEYGMFVCRK